MKKSLIIRIPQPCSEPWFDMEATKNGRHCANCQKEVVDFSHFSNRQAADFLAEESGEICGRFYPNQLNKNIFPASAASYSGLSLPALALLAATLTVNPAQSQVNVPLTAISPNDSLRSTAPVVHVISGTVIDERSHEGAFGVLLELRYQGAVIQKAMPDFDGRFAFSVEQTILFDSISASSPDYLEQLVPFSPQDGTTVPTIYLQPSTGDGTMIVGTITVSKKHMHKNRRRYRREQRRLNK